MEKWWSIRTGSALAALAFCGAAFALEVPTGTELQIRLKTKVSTKTSRPQDTVEAVVIAPVMVGGQFAIPAGSLVHGAVEKATESEKGDERSLLVLSFTQIEIGAAKVKLAARVDGVDNAREKVDDQGQINGILASDTITGKLDTEIGKLTERYSGLASVLGKAKSAVLKPAESDITYEAGVELSVKLTAPLVLRGAAGPGPAAQLKPVANEAALLRLVMREPFQTVAQSPAKPSDITNLMLIGSREQVEEAFREAGWSTAKALSTEAKFETLRALAEDRGYDEAPVSVLLLEGKPPDLVYEKLNNTFARRHHLRMWLRPSAFQGLPVWAVAATHDTGINFSEPNRTFIHRVDSAIDAERAKVVNDLLFTGRVESLALVDRPDVPRQGQNATGDNRETDGKIAVLVLK
jgi:hypothetical protein